MKLLKYILIIGFFYSCTPEETINPCEVDKCFTIVEVDERIKKELPNGIEVYSIVWITYKRNCDGFFEKRLYENIKVSQLPQVGQVKCDI